MKKNDSRLLVVVCSFRSWRPVIECSSEEACMRWSICWEKGTLSWEGPLHHFLGTFLFWLLCVHNTLILSLAPSDWAPSPEKVGAREKVGTRCLFPGAQVLRGKHCVCLILMFCLFCLDTRLKEGFFSFSPVNWARPPTARVTACAPMLYEGSVIERQEGFLSWQGSCLQSQFVLYHAAFPPGWVLFLSRDPSWSLGHLRKGVIPTYVPLLHTYWPRFPSVMVSYIPRNTDQYQPKNTNSGCNSSIHVIVYSSFVKERISIKKAGELS